MNREICLPRKPFGRWPKGRLIWSTEFNDVRPANSLGATKPDRQKTFLRELKTLALFYPTTVISEADLINHTGIQEMVIENKLGFRTALERKAFAFSLWETSSSFSETNEMAGKKRAFPNRYKAVKPVLAKIDEFLSEIGLEAVETPFFRGDQFQDFITTVQNSPSLENRDKEQLAIATEHARAKEPEGALRFGSIYRYLTSTFDLQASSELLQVCRVAHAMAIPVGLGVPMSTSNQDISFRAASTALGYESPKANFDERVLFEFFPRVLLSNQTFDSLDFHQILALRNRAVEIGYFEALEKVYLTGKNKPKAFGKIYEAYLNHLDEYLKCLQIDARLQLTSFQKNVVRESVEQSKWKYRRNQFVFPCLVGWFAYLLSKHVEVAALFIEVTRQTLPFIRHHDDVKNPPLLNNFFASHLANDFAKNETNE